MKNDKPLVRCAWSVSHPLLLEYHDQEWGVPIHSDRHWFEKLTLDGAQAGLSWLTILKKRAGYRAAFHDFDVARVARYGEQDLARLLADSGIVRNRQKLQSAIRNAQLFLELQREFGSFDAFLWAQVGGRPVQPKRKSSAEVPARTELSDALSTLLKKRGFKFVGSTIVYAFLQAGGAINDHTIDCFRHRALARVRR